jgi:methanol:N,N-dimethyl-4-nitrosoaniline oxidoreductase
LINENIREFPIYYSLGWGMGRIANGWGAHKTVADECKQLGIKKALIVTTGLKGTGIVDEINQILTTQGVATEIFSGVTSNPKDSQVMAGYKVFMEAKCDGVVSVGGGSSHDCGKGIRAVASNDGLDISNFQLGIDPPWMEQIKQYQACTIPQVSINTTSGTGAENTACGAISQSNIMAKRLVLVHGLAPSIAINDPLLIRCQPAHIAAQTGFDGFCHAFESYVSRMQPKYSTVLAAGAIKLIAENLREFAFNRMDHVACENVIWASSMSGALGLSCGGGVGVVHGFGHGLSVLYDVHHGLASAVVTIPGERYNQPQCPDKFAEMARTMGVDTTNMTKMQASDAWFTEVERLLDDLNIQTGNLKRFGLKKEDIPHIVKVQHSLDLTVQGNPTDYNYEELVALFESQL